MILPLKFSLAQIVCNNTNYKRACCAYKHSRNYVAGVMNTQIYPG